VGRDGGYTKKIGDGVLVIPTVNNDRITPHTEGFQSIIWHLIVSHPKLQINNTKWESIKK
jgi:D-sedoheptulose 7-phosphate isomerase